MGKDGIFKREVEKIMNSQAGKEFIKDLKKARSTGVEVDRKTFNRIHTLVTNALRRAQNIAASRIEQKGQIEQKTSLNKQLMMPIYVVT